MVWERYGDILVDAGNRRAYGINGCTVEDFSLKANTIHLKVISELEWEVPLRIVFRNVPLGKRSLVINGKHIGTFEPNELKTGISWFPKRE
ncbi:MAG: hypothetical protein NTX46_02250 [Chloroflexi bacterium]|nr:hypothetical protein [Chloroflexota bacterium]